LDQKLNSNNYFIAENFSVVPEVVVYLYFLPIILAIHVSMSNFIFFTFQSLNVKIREIKLTENFEEREIY
jgi:hypothetical protein